MSLMSDYGIFLEESFIMSRSMVIGLAVLAMIVATVEYSFQRSGIGFLSVLGANLLYFAVLWLVLLMGEFIFAWRSHYLGGEIPAVIILLILFTIISSFLKSVILKAGGLHFAHNWLFVILPSLIVLVPVVLFMLYAFALGSAWKN